MNRNWTFGEKLGLGFGATVLLMLLSGVIAVVSLRNVVNAKDDVISTNAQALIETQRLTSAVDRRVAAVRGYFLSGNARFLDELAARRSDFSTIIASLRERVRDTEGRRLLDELARDEADYRASSDRLIAQRQGEGSLEAVSKAFEQDLAPKRDAMVKTIDAINAHGTEVLERERAAATALATSATNLLFGVQALILLLAVAIAYVLSSTTARQIGSAAGHVQSSSAELQAASNQQASSAREQATAMSEISTTISELLSTSRQIAESAQRVAQLAEHTASAARSGDATVERGTEAVNGIRRQVELIVNHMLDLGRKSQQIGSVLEIVAELAEQTNILAINATIEAAGAGEAGRRFAVVAEEIRKLADRVGGSTKEIRGLIEDVRSAVNTTVMTTETGSKAAEAGARQFSEVAAAFKQIATLVVSTTEAAKEIELSTKQQTTAVEQVNVAITNVAQASKENEVSTAQTLQTASQLTELARELLRLVKSQVELVPARGAGAFGHDGR